VSACQVHVRDVLDFEGRAAEDTGARDNIADGIVNP
jgi:hypothetical protein